MIIHVTQEDINIGIPRHRCCCPIANAIKRCLNLNKHLDMNSVNVNYSEIYIQGQKYLLPKKAIEFLDNFDYNKFVQPFTFII